MTTKPRELGNNAADAIDDVDELLDSTRRALRRGIAFAFRGDINAVGEAISDALEHVALAEKIVTLTRGKEYGAAARILPEYRSRESKP